jgi:hypothetical protein
MNLSGSFAECNTHTAGHCLNILSSLLKTDKDYRMQKNKSRWKAQKSPMNVQKKQRLNPKVTADDSEVDSQSCTEC